MKYLLISIMLIVGSASVIADDYYVFKVQSEDDTLRAGYKTKDPDESLWTPYQNKNKEHKVFYRIYVTEVQLNAGWDALAEAVKDAGKDLAKDTASESENSSIDVQALIDVIAELTGTPAGQVKSKFKNAKKEKEK